MRLFEVLILMGGFISLAGFFIPTGKRPRLFAWVPFLSAILILIHLGLEKFRWQMVPAYLLILCLVLITLFRRRPKAEEGKRPSRGRRVMAVVVRAFGILAFLLCAVLPWLFPVVNLPRPTGPYAVGTTSFQFIDDSRPETLATPPGARREFMVRAWYPAVPAPGSKPIPYWEKANIIGPLRVNDLHGWGLKWIPGFFFNHFSLMKTNSYPDAPLAGGPASFPVIVFSPGGGVIHEHNYLQMEELASQGYVVLSLSHPYESWVVIFSDGRVVRANQFKPKKAETQEEKDREKRSLELAEKLEKKTTKSVEERKAIMREIFALDPDKILDKLLKVRVLDVRFALDELRRMNSGERESPFKGKLDLTRLGVYGMSLGGATAGQACLEDHRITAGVNLDGTQFGSVIDGYMTQPFMFMNSGESLDHNDFVYDRMTNDAYSVIIAGSSHMDYTDMFFTTPLVKRLSRKSIPDKRMYRVANAYLLAFFDKYLKGAEAPLLTGPSQAFPEVTFKIIARKST
jgi:predicted dienelactone hydrolase